MAPISEPDRYAPPVIVDVTWCAPPDGARVPLPPALQPFVLGLYGMLRHPIDVEDPTRSAYGLVRRPGVGIPVQLGRPLAALAADFEASPPRQTLRLVVALLDEPTGETVSHEKAMRKLLAQKGRALQVVPVVLHPMWRHLAGAGEVVQPGDPRSVGDVSTIVAARLANWLMAADDPEERQAQVQIFVSHTDSDAEVAKQVVKRLRAHVAQSDMSGLVDAHRVPKRDDLASHLRRHQRSSVFLSLRTDRYSDSVSAMTELLTAKELQVPCVTVWMVSAEERRASPYGGNMPVLSWNDDRIDEVITRCLQAWLHHLHFHRLGERIRFLADLQHRTTTISRPPEMIDLAMGGLPADGECLVLYPEPPMSVVEEHVLRQAQPRLRLATPSTVFAGAAVRDDPAPPLAGRCIALSLSASADAPDVRDGAHRDGYTSLHVDETLSRITLAVIRAGARIAYGDVVVSPRRGEQHFARLLAETLEHNGTLGVGPTEPPLMFVPSHRAHGSSDLPVQRQECGQHLTADDPSPAAQALQLSAMRVAMAQECDARISLGGRRDTYVGRFPGHAEECLAMLDAGKPIYVLAGFGGGAGMVADALLGRDLLVEHEAQRRARDPAWSRMADAYDVHPQRSPDAPRSVTDLARRLAAHGDELNDDATRRPWRNGLTRDENLRLFASRDPDELAYLVTKGLRAKLPRERTAARAPGTGPRVQLFRGRLVDLQEIGDYAITVLDGPALVGEAATLDERLGGSLSARLRGRLAAVETVAVGGARLRGHGVLVVPLGRVSDPRAPSERMAVAGADLARAVHHRGTEHLAVANLGAPLGLNGSVAARRLLEALTKHAPNLRTLTLCEEDPGRYRALGDTFPDARPLGESPFQPVAERPEAPITIALHREGDRLFVSALAPADAAAPTELRADPIDLGPHLPWLDALVGGDARQSPIAPELELRGAELAENLLTPRARSLIEATPDRPIDLIVDHAAAGVPWEILALHGRGDPIVPALRGGIRRRLEVDTEVAAVPARRIADDRLALLLIVDPHDNLTAARNEVRSIERRLRARLRVDVEMLAGSDATVDAVRDALAGRRWDAMHYAGHAVFDPDHRWSSGLLLANNGRLTPETLGPDTRLPPLVVFNACESSRVRGGDAPAHVAGSAGDEGLARMVLTSGVRTFIGTFWRVEDAAAAMFAEHLYERLVDGATIAKALWSARHALRAPRETSGEWANYVLYGDSELRF